MSSCCQLQQRIVCDTRFRCVDNELSTRHRGRHHRDRMVVGFTTTYEINTYHH